MYSESHKNRSVLTMLSVACMLLVAGSGVRAQQAGASLKAPEVAVPAPVARAYSLEDLLALALRENLALESARAQAAGGRAGVATARAYPNPEVEILGSSARPRAPGSVGGGGSTVSVTQRIENPALRRARADAATVVAQTAEINVRVVESGVFAEIKERFFETMKRAEELDAAREDLRLTEQIRDRIRVRTRSGEGARFDLYRADVEVSLAAKQAERAVTHVDEARARLTQAVGTNLTDNFTLAGDFYRKTPQADYHALRNAVLMANPEIKRALSELGRAEKQVDVERAQALPVVAVRISRDDEPDMRTTRAGVVVSLPLWDRRRGPIDEARAQAIKSRTDADLRRFVLVQAFEAGWQQYQAALKSVQALEGGIVDQARTVVDIAEAAYRFGERGILEYLDARRQFRAVRAELITARFELHAAKAELERLAAHDLKGE